MSASCSLANEVALVSAEGMSTSGEPCIDRESEHKMRLMALELLEKLLYSLLLKRPQKLALQTLPLNIRVELSQEVVQQLHALLDWPAFLPEPQRIHPLLRFGGEPLRKALEVVLDVHERAADGGELRNMSCIWKYSFLELATEILITIITHS